MHSEKEKKEIGLFYTKIYQNMLDTLSEEQQKEYEFYVTRINDVGVLQLNSLPLPHLNCTIGLGFKNPVTDNEINKILALSELHHSVPITFRVSEKLSKPENLADLLTSKYNMKYNGKMYCFIRNLEDIPDKKSDIIVKNINTSPEYQQIFIDILLKGFEIAEPYATIFASMTKASFKKEYHESVKNLIAFDKDTPIGVASVFIDKESKIAFLGNATTLVEHRGKGAQGALISHRLQLAKDSGCKYATVECGDDSPEHRNHSYQNILRYGFEIAFANLMYTPEK